jgi:hypothetical protein
MDQQIINPTMKREIKYWGLKPCWNKINDFKKARRLVLFNLEFVMFTRPLLGITGRPTDPVEDDLIPSSLMLLATFSTANYALEDNWYP